MAEGLRRSPGSRRRNNLEPRSRESLRRPRDPHHRRHRLPRQGGADDAARPLSGRGQDLRPRASARRRDGRRPFLRQGRRNAAVPTAARTPRRRLRGLPAKEMRRSCRRRHRFDARPLRGAGQRAHRQAGVRDQLRGARHLQSLAGAGGAAEYRGGTQRRGAVQEDGRDARAHLHLFRRGNTSRPGVRGRAVDRQLSEGARSRRGGARPLRRRCRAEGRRRRRGAAARAGGRRHSCRDVSRRGRPPARGKRAGTRGTESARTRMRTRTDTSAEGVIPFYVRRSVELVALYKRRKMDERVAEGKRSAFENWIDTFLEPYPASKELYYASSAPLFRAAAKGLRKLIAERGASWGAPRTTALLARADQALEGVDRQLAALEMTWDLFLPFVAGERFIFQCKHTRQLWAQLSEDDRAKLPWDPEAIDWRRYWMEVHMRGLEEWVFPGLEEETKALKREVSQPKDLLALLAAARHAFGPRVPLRLPAGEARAGPPPPTPSAPL